MGDRMDRVPEGSAAYREFARLYALARSIRPTAFDGWNRQLFATTGDQRGCFNTRTGAIRVSGPLLAECVTGPETVNRRRRAPDLGDRGSRRPDSAHIRGLTRGLEKTEEVLTEGLPWSDPPATGTR
jgi:hypothetical protein